MTTLSQQMREVEREIAMRKLVYGKQVARGTMSPHEAKARIETMEAVLASLIDLANMRDHNIASESYRRR